MSVIRWLPVIFVFLTISGCAEKPQETTRGQINTVSVEVAPEQFLQASSPAIISVGSVGENPASILKANEGWRFYGSPYSFEVVGLFQDLNSIPDIRITLPNNKGEVNATNFRISGETDETGNAYQTLKADQNGFHTISVGIIDKKTFANNWVIADSVVDAQWDKIPVRLYKTKLTQEEKENRKVWRVSISGEYSLK